MTDRNPAAPATSTEAMPLNNESFLMTLDRGPLFASLGFSKEWEGRPG